MGAVIGMLSGGCSGESGDVVEDRITDLGVTWTMLSSDMGSAGGTLWYDHPLTVIDADAAPDSTLALLLRDDQVAGARHRVLFVRPDGTRITSSDFGAEPVLTTGAFLDGGSFCAAGGTEGLVLIRVDRDGSVVREVTDTPWSEQSPAQELDQVVGMPGGDLVACGAAGLPGSGDREGFIARYGPDGARVWVRACGPQGMRTVDAVAVMPGGRIAAIGQASEDTTYAVVFLVLEGTGEVVSVRRYEEGDAPIHPARIMPLDDGGSVLAGTWFGPQGNRTLRWIIRISASGDVLWRRAALPEVTGAERPSAWATFGGEVIACGEVRPDEELALEFFGLEDGASVHGWTGTSRHPLLAAINGDVGWECYVLLSYYRAGGDRAAIESP